MSQPPRNWRRVVVSSVATSLLGLHFLASALHVGPINPIQIRAHQYTQSWLLPYFEQTWTLFAPDPISEDRGMLARFRCEDESVTDWVDVTTKHIQTTQQNRFFPARNSRLVSNGSTLLTSNDPIAERLRARVKDAETKDRAGGNDGAAVPLSVADKHIRERGLQFLSGYAMREAPDACPGGAIAVQLRMVQHLFPPFSQRHRWNETGEVNETDFKWVTTRDLVTAS